MTTHDFGPHGTVRFTDWGAITSFPDGTSCPSTPHDTHHYHVIAHRCGYGDDILRYCQEHDFAHMLIEAFVHERPSRVLWGLAHGEEISAKDALYEELAAQTLQRFVRAGERPIIGGIDWEQLRIAFLNSLGQRAGDGPLG